MHQAPKLYVMNGFYAEDRKASECVCERAKAGFNSEYSIDYHKDLKLYRVAIQTPCTGKTYRSIYNSIKRLYANIER